MEPNSTLGEPIGVVHVTINGQKVPPMSMPTAPASCRMARFERSNRRWSMHCLQRNVRQRFRLRLLHNRPPLLNLLLPAFSLACCSARAACRTSARCSDSADHDAVWCACSERTECTVGRVSSTCSGHRSAVFPTNHICSLYS